MIIDNIVKNGKIDISESEWNWWKDLKKEEDSDVMDAIKHEISDEIYKNNVPLPLKHPTLSEALKDFKRLCKFDAMQLLIHKKFYTKYEYSVKPSNILISQTRIGNKSSDYFHYKERFACDSITAPSPKRVWKDERFRLTLLNGLWSLKFKKVGMSELAYLILSKKYVASQFKPAVAKCLYQSFGAKRVLDFSAGWGDRLAGFCATLGTEYYLGVDPNTSLHKNYKAQIEAYNVHKKIEMINKPAEDVTLDQKFDFIFTSPPYFDLERYSDDEMQSWKRYKVPKHFDVKHNDRDDCYLNRWLEGFLFKSIDNSYNALDKDGYIVINISDVYCHHRINQICDPMIKFMHGYKDLKFVGFWGMSLSVRQNSAISRSAHLLSLLPVEEVENGLFAEPIFIWKKT